MHDLGLTRLVDYDAEGRPNGIDWNAFSVHLLALTKQQANRLDQLASEVAALTARLAALEGA